MVSRFIRDAKKDDLGSILGLLYQLSPKTPGEEDPREELINSIIDDSAYHLVVYEEDGRVIGTAMLFVQKNLSHGGRPAGRVENVVTDKSARGRGIGQNLTAYLTKLAEELGCYKRTLTCSEENVEFYERCGYRRSGVEMRND